MVTPFVLNILNEQKLQKILCRFWNVIIWYGFIPNLKSKIIMVNLSFNFQYNSKTI